MREFFHRLFDRRDPTPAEDAPAESDQALLVYLRLSDDQFGAEEEREAIHAMTDRMSDAIEAQGAGEFDGDEFGAGECTLFMYGPDADALFAAVEPILRDNPLARGGHAIKRYGPAGDLAAREVRVEL